MKVELARIDADKEQPFFFTKTQSIPIPAPLLLNEMRQLFLDTSQHQKLAAFEKKFVEFDSIMESHSATIGNDSKSCLPAAPTIK